MPPALAGREVADGGSLRSRLGCIRRFDQRRDRRANSWITHQRIGVGRKSHGDLVVVSKAPLGHVDQVLLGHVNSLLALDFEKPARLRQAQQQLNSHALGLLLGGEHDLTPAWAQLAQVADSSRQIRALVIECETAPAMNVVRAAVTDAVERAGYPLFLHAAERQPLQCYRAAKVPSSSGGWPPNWAAPHGG